MKCGARVAIGVAGGYFLGRTKKMKLALMLAGMAAGRQAGGAGALLSQGKNLLNASPELLRLSDELKGRLLEAGKGAALAVATRQVEAMTDRVAGRVESSLGNIGGRAQPSKDSAEADSAEAARDEVDEVDEDYDEDYDSVEESQDAGVDDVPAEVGARSDSNDDGRATSSATRRTQGGARKAKGAARTPVRRTAGAASGSRRNAERTAGRPSRARRRDDSG